jgi:D-alanine-D-alanine ligase
MEELSARPIALDGARKFVKPVREGSGKGIYNSSIVSTPEELEREVRRVLADFDQPALVEDYLEGREFTVAMLGNGAELRALPIIEMTFDGLPADAQPIYGYESKWIYDLPDKPVEDCYKCPAPLDEAMRERVERICRDAFRVLACRDWARIDVRCDAHDQPHIIEVNPLPGIIPDPNAHSSFPMAARAAGMDYDAIIHAVLDAALRRSGMPGLAQRSVDGRMR